MDVQLDAEVLKIKAFEDCAERITDSLMRLTDKEESLAFGFYNCFLRGKLRFGESPDATKRARVKAKDQKRNFKVALGEVFVNAFELFGIFYEPFYKCGSEDAFPSVCRYEVLIPFDQATSAYFNYWIVPQGADYGQKIISFRHVLFNLMSDYHEAVFAPLRSVSKFNANHVKTIYDKCFDFKETSKDYIPLGGVITLNKGRPWLRLPCYNIPMQCVCEMLAAEYGGFLGEDIQIWNQMVKAGAA